LRAARDGDKTTSAAPGLYIERSARCPGVVDMNMGVGIAIGVAIGIGIGAAMDNIGVGIAIGVGIGVAIGGMFTTRKNQDKKPPDTPSN